MVDKNKKQMIKEAAEELFLKKGYDGTTVRDIVSLAGVNVALVNYHFKNKERLFIEIILDKMKLFMKGVATIADNRDLSLEVKIDFIVNRYCDNLLAQPEIPIFLLSEIKRDPTVFSQIVGEIKSFSEIDLFKQIREVNPDIDPIHMFVNVISLTIFPFVAKDIVGKIITPNMEFKSFIDERRTLIPLWVMLMFKK